jgi:hypothetical protein
MSPIEKNTNQALRSKYFADSSQIVSQTRGGKHEKHQTARIIRANHVRVKGSHTLLRPGEIPSDDTIKVNVVRDGNVVKAIQIKCPCGRHADLNCEYSPDI